jgi:hypothetical protein
LKQADYHVLPRPELNDSLLLNQVINQKEDNIETKNKTIKDLNKTITDLNIKISNCNLTNDVKQQKIDFLEAKIKNLNDSIFKLVQLSPKNFKFPYEYGKKIVFGDAYYSTHKKKFTSVLSTIPNNWLYLLNDHTNVFI